MLLLNETEYEGRLLKRVFSKQRGRTDSNYWADLNVRVAYSVGQTYKGDLRLEQVAGSPGVGVPVITLQIPRQQASVRMTAAMFEILKTSRVKLWTDVRWVTMSQFAMQDLAKLLAAQADKEQVVGAAEWPVHTKQVVVLTKEEKIEEQLEALAAKEKRWTTKLKLAQTKLKGIRAKRKYYERRRKALV